MTANEQLYDAILRHQTYLLRYSGTVRNRAFAILAETEEDIARRIRDRLANNEGLTTPVEVRRMQSLVAAVQKIRSGAWDAMTAWWTEEMTALSYQEPIVMTGIVATAAPVLVSTVLPSEQLLKSIVLSRPFEGRILKEWAVTMQAEDLRRIQSAIQLGMVAGESGTAIARRVVGTGALNGADGVMEMTRRQVAAITRTAVQHVANNARDLYFQENADILENEQFVATLDSRTTAVCRAYDGKIYPVGKGPRPPLHFQCRSLRIASLDGVTLGFRPAKASTEKQLLREFTASRGLGKVTSRANLPRGTKGDYDAFSRSRVRELTGRVPAATTYQAWLKRQSNQFQEDTLGVTKAKLFRSGGLTLDKFVAANGTELTLSELATKHASAFRAAGLDPQDFR